MKGSAQPLQPFGGQLPISVAPCTSQQVQLAIQAPDEAGPKLVPEHRIVACRRREGEFEISESRFHGLSDGGQPLKAGFQVVYAVITFGHDTPPQPRFRRPE